MAHARHEVHLVFFDFLAPAASIALLAPPQLMIDGFEG
jgi:hypothetical protein